MNMNETYCRVINNLYFTESICNISELVFKIAHEGLICWIWLGWHNVTQTAWLLCFGFRIVADHQV